MHQPAAVVTSSIKSSSSSASQTPSARSRNNKHRGIHFGGYRMKHLIPFTKDQLQIVQASLQLSLKYADSQYVDNVDEIMQIIEDNSSL